MAGLPGKSLKRMHCLTNAQIEICICFPYLLIDFFTVVKYAILNFFALQYSFFLTVFLYSGYLTWFTFTEAYLLGQNL